MVKKFGGKVLFPGDKDIFFRHFPEFLFSLRFDPLATTLLCSYQWHKRVIRLQGNKLNREAGNLQPSPVASVSRLTGPHPSKSDTGGGGLCLFCRWWIEKEGIIDNSSSLVRTVAGTFCCYKKTYTGQVFVGKVYCSCFQNACHWRLMAFICWSKQFHQCTLKSSGVRLFLKSHLKEIFGTKLKQECRPRILLWNITTPKSLHPLNYC